MAVLMNDKKLIKIKTTKLCILHNEINNIIDIYFI